MAEVTIRPAERGDCALIAELVRALAEYEREPQSARLTAEDFEHDGFGEQPAFECLIGEVDGVGCGLALFFPYYSTWEGRGIYLEDLFVRPEYRGFGLGKALLTKVASLTVKRGAVRLDWSVLAWNEPGAAVLRRAWRGAAGRVAQDAAVRRGAAGCR